MRAVDLDDVAVEVAAETARRNGVVVDVRRADVLEDELPASDVVVANIELEVVERMLERLDARGGRDVRLPRLGAADGGVLGTGRPRRARGLGGRRSREAALS